jgi:hypothetical protein
VPSHNVRLSTFVIKRDFAGVALAAVVSLICRRISQGSKLLVTSYPSTEML